MKGLNAFLGWLLMLAVLAVPSFLFFNWWSKNKTQSAGELTVKTSGKDVFSSAEQRPGAAQPVPRGAASATASLSPVSTGAARGPAQPADAAFDAAAQSVEPARPQRVLPAQDARQSATAREPALSTEAARLSYYTPRTDRNPMLSQDDYRRIKEAERLRAEKERADRMGQKRVASLEDGFNATVESRYQPDILLQPDDGKIVGRTQIRLNRSPASVIDNHHVNFQRIRKDAVYGLLQGGFGIVGGYQNRNFRFFGHITTPPCRITCLRPLYRLGAAAGHAPP